MNSDIGIINEVLSGDREKFSELVKRHQKSLLRMCIRFTKSTEVAEDIVQETFIKAFKKLHLFEGRAAFKSWLFQIAMNTAKNKMRSARDHANIDDVQISTGAGMEIDLIKENLKALLLKGVEALPKKQKIALQLRIYEDLSFKEIAEIMECPYDTAKANFRHAIINIKKTLKQNELLDHWSAIDAAAVTEIKTTTTNLKSS